jgi:hypothetical protein
MIKEIIKTKQPKLKNASERAAWKKASSVSRKLCQLMKKASHSSTSNGPAFTHELSKILAHEWNADKVSEAIEVSTVFARRIKDATKLEVSLEFTVAGPENGALSNYLRLRIHPGYPKKMQKLFTGVTVYFYAEKSDLLTLNT